ncbi:MAG TPA: plastocyanin/azurin family copper-binding protein [Ktedonobacteraceae bacterium]|jgi:plastocyanin
MINFVQGAIGIIVLLVVVGGLLFIYYSRTNAVEKTGYGSLIMLALISLMIPVFWITENGNQASAKSNQFESSIQRGMVIYAENCTDQCYGIDSQGHLLMVTYNGYTIQALDKLLDPDLNRIISAGIYNPQAQHQPANLGNVPRSDQYNGGLLSNDVSDLQNFIRSADPSFLQKNGYPHHNAFNDLPAYLQAQSPAQYDAAVTFAKNGQFGTLDTSQANQKHITLDIVTPGSNSVSCASQMGCFTPINIQVKVGTTITWVNNSNMAHTVTAVTGQDLSKPTPAPQIFDSASDSKFQDGLIPPGQSFSYKVTEAAYNLDPTNHRVIYFCRIHPDMLAQLVIVK